jgi:hypothetical protein
MLSAGCPCCSLDLPGPVHAGVASGLLNTSQTFGAAIGVAVASSIAASDSRALLHHGYTAAAALAGGLHWAIWVCGLTGLAAIPVAFMLIRRPSGVRDTLVGKEDEAVTDDPAAGQAERLGASGLAEQALAIPDHDREDEQPQLIH